MKISACQSGKELVGQPGMAHVPAHWAKHEPHWRFQPGHWRHR